MSFEITQNKVLIINNTKNYVSLNGFRPGKKRELIEHDSSPFKAGLQ